MAAAPIIYLAVGVLQLRCPAGSGAWVQFAPNVSAASVVPVPGDESSVTTLDGIVHTRFGATAYTLDFTAQQDWSATGLSRWLWTNRGQLADFVVLAYPGPTPTTGAPGFQGQITVAAGAYGGEVDSWISADLSLPVVGEPTLLTAAPAMAETAAIPWDIRTRTITIPTADEPAPAEV